MLKTNFFTHIPNKNIHTLFSFTNQGLPKQEESLCVHFSTGCLRVFSQTVSEQWGKVKITYTGSLLHLEQENGTIQPLSFIATKVIQSTLSKFHTMCQKDMDHIVDQLSWDFQNKLQTNPHKTDFFQQAEVHLGVSAHLLSQITNPQDLADHVFDLVQLKLEEPTPLDEEGIEAIHAMLFESLIKKFSEQNLTDSYHPCWVIDRLHEAVSALRSKNPELAPTPTLERRKDLLSGTDENIFAGANGSYFLKGLNGEKLWVMKPAKEEKEGIMTDLKAGEGVVREHLATVLNYSRLFPIPYTAYVTLDKGPCSLQAFVQGQSLITLQTHPNKETLIEKLPVLGMQATLAFDILMNDTDRHLGNIMVAKSFSHAEEFIPEHIYAIDNGGCLPVSLQDPPKFEQLDSPALLKPIHPDLLQFLLEEHELVDAEILRAHGIPEAAVQRMINAAVLLRTAAQQSLASREEQGPEITLYDLGLIVLKNPTWLWEKESQHEFARVCKDIIFLKKQMQENCQKEQNRVKIQRRSMQQMKSAYDNETKNPQMVMCLFGVHPSRNAQRDEVDIDRSIVWKHAETILKS